MQSTALVASEIRAFHVAQDAPWLHRLWNSSMHARWSLSIGAMQQVLGGARSLMVAERNGVRVGFCATDYKPSGDAGLLALLVEPAYQRQGVGSALLAATKHVLEGDKVELLHLGASSNGSYFWPGLPAENDSALPFFVKHGWQQQESCADLVQDLTSFNTPIWVSDRISNANIVFRLADPDLRSNVAAFERTYFPAWAAFIENEFADAGDRNILVAQTRDGAIVGTILMQAGISNRWSPDGGIRIGSLNILGIAPGNQRQGIGLALTARAMEILRDRGCSKCYIQWTGLNDWYGKLGATVWAEYRMASRCLRQH